MATVGTTVKAEASIYDEEGRTCLPKEIRQSLGVEKGDKVKYINAEGTVVVKPVEGE